MVKVTACIASFAAASAASATTMAMASMQIVNQVSSINGVEVSEFAAFVQRFNKTYSADEFAARFEIFATNFVAYSALEIPVGPHFDLTQTELEALYPTSGFSMPAEELRSKLGEFEKKFLRANVEQDLADDELPTEFSWKECYSGVRDQSHCGSCWAFAAAAAVEGAYCAAGEKLPGKGFLSTMQMVDCNLENGGCNGGSIGAPLKYAVETGLCAEEEYPYFNLNDGVDRGETVEYDEKGSVVRNKECKLNTCSKTYKIAAYEDVQFQGGVEMAKKLMKYGPLTTAVGAHAAIKNYTEGVITRKNCFLQLLPNHAVTITGFKLQENGRYAFEIRNSWTEKYGDKGYFWLEHGACALGFEIGAAKLVDDAPEPTPEPTAIRM